jgi:hypothetical protein
MAFQTEERLILLKQVVLRRTMCLMAVSAVLTYRRMLEYEWSFVLRVALEAGLSDAFISQIELVTAVRIVAAPT